MTSLKPLKIFGKKPNKPLKRWDKISLNGSAKQLKMLAELPNSRTSTFMKTPGQSLAVLPWAVLFLVCW